MVDVPRYWENQQMLNGPNVQLCAVPAAGVVWVRGISTWAIARRTTLLMMRGETTRLLPATHYPRSQLYTCESRILSENEKEEEKNLVYDQDISL
jgi:hypothetical protein